MPQDSSEQNSSGNYTPSDFERKACRYVDKTFEINEQYWKKDHEKQHRLFDMILQAPVKDKPDIAGRSNIKTGVSWMIHQLIFSILKNSLLTLPQNVRIDPTITGKVILWLEEMQEYLDRLVNDEEWPVHGNLRQSLFDLISHGTSVLRPYYRNDLRMAWDGENDIETLAYSGPDLPYISSWDTYPTAGATHPNQLHEVIFYEYYYPHELRELEREGRMQNVDALLEDYDFEGPEAYSTGETETNEPREQHSELNVDSSGRIGVLVYWGLYPLYEGDEYIGEDGKDRSKVEVECLIIKARDKEIPLFIDRNPYFHQQKEVIFAKYFNIPGLFWGESVFGVMERMLVHQEDWFNIIQDSANSEVYRDRVFSDAIPAEQRKQKGVGRDYVVDKDLYEKMGGNVMKYIDRGMAILPDTYDQRNHIDRVIQEVGGIMDFLNAAGSETPKTATEVNKLAASLNIRFEQTAMEVGSSLLVPALAWACSLLSSDEANDEFIGEQIGSEIMGQPINPFKQFDSMMPNSRYRIKLEGTIRSVQNSTLQRELQQLIEQGKDIGPGPNENGEVVIPNITQMYFDAIKLTKLPDPNKYEMPWTPPVGPDGEPIEDEGAREENVQGA